MLEQKWAKTDRFGAPIKIERSGIEWQKSLGYRWAVVKLAKDEDADKEKGTPSIEKIPERQPQVPQRSVNEMLAEMRLKDSGTGAAAAKGRDSVNLDC